jgi:hypothetical protein
MSARFATACACAAALSGSASAQAPALDQVLERMSAYLLAYEGQLMTVAADERFEERYRLKTGTSFYAVDNRQTLLSDFIFLRPPGGHAWIGFRDAYMVDGKPVRDRAPRVQQALSAGGDGAIEEANRIIAQNARYSTGPLYRTINVPTQSLDLLHPRYRSRFAFRKGGEEQVDSRRVWMIGYRETVRPTVISTPDGDDWLSSGVVWVDPSTGAIVRTQLDIDDPGRKTSPARVSRIMVSYALDRGLGFLVPREMTERYAAPTSPFQSYELTTRARYTNFRQFQTTARVIER